MMVRVIKKDHTKEAFNIQKVVIAVNKSANRVLYTFTEDELCLLYTSVGMKLWKMVLTLSLLTPARSPRYRTTKISVLFISCARKIRMP